MTAVFILLAVLVALVLLAWIFHIYPAPRMVWVALAPAAISTVMLLTPEALWWILPFDLGVLSVLIFDALFLPRRRTFSVERKGGTIASLGKPHEVELTILNHAHLPRSVEVRDHAPAELGPDPDEFSLDIPARSRATVHYDIRARRRGAFTLPGVSLRATSVLGLWQRFLFYPCGSRLSVYPDMQQLGEYALLARTNRLNLMGMRRTRRIGGDNEFERLRDYTRDDNYKHIDWRSTARRNKLTVKDFQANQSQRIIFLLDCGRMMTTESHGVSLLDHALNALLMLSFVALRRGDQVGMLAFSDRIHRYVPPRGGMNQTNHIIHATYDQFPHMVESRYDEAFIYLSKNCRKRALVVLVTNVIDEVNAHQLEQYLGGLSGRHLPLGVLLRDERLFTAVAEHGESYFRAAAAAEILTWRRQVLTDLGSRGVLTLDLAPENLAAPLVSQYLDIKARHLL